MKRLFIMALTSLLVTVLLAQNINKAEYFFDHDPGQGNGTLIPIATPGDVVNFPVNIPLNGLATGFHLLGIRVCDVNGKWSMYDHRNIYILSAPGTNVTDVTAAEYFFDHDPGPGAGTPTSVGTAGTVVNFSASIPATLTPGFHWLGIRTKDSDGKWGLYARRDFYLTGTPVDMTGVAAAEYFFDHDPGVGNGTPLAFNTPAYVVTQTFAIPTTGLSSGGHLLVMRVKDQQGNWGLFVKDSVHIGTTTISCPANVTVDATTAQCTAVVNGLEPTVTPAGTNYNYTLTGATTGSGIGSASGHTFNAGVTTVTYGIATAPSVNCSFTVTVNANATPSVTISATQTTICAGTSVTFTPTPTNGGNNPTYVWKVNGINVGTGTTYQSSTLANNDVVTAVMTSSSTCVSQTTATSNSVTITVSSAVAPSVTISASQTNICAGTTVTFTPTPTNGGSNPTYTWIRNEQVVGTGPTYQSSTFTWGEYVYVVMTSSLACANPVVDTSGFIQVFVYQPTPPTVNVLVSPQTSICQGGQVHFFAQVLNGYGNQTYQWKRNGVNFGPNAQAFYDSTINNNDSITVTVTSPNPCPSCGTVTSAPVVFSVGQEVVPSVSITASQTITCPGQQVTFTANPVNPGSTPTYTWVVNYSQVGTGSTYQTSSLQNGDTIRLYMVSSEFCAFNPNVEAPPLGMTVNSAVTPIVTINASQTSICNGTSVTFTATPTNGGSNPSYVWKKNGINVGTGVSYQSSTLANNDVITAVMTSSLACANPTTDTSNAVTMTVSSQVAPTALITATSTDICAGTNVTFNATVTGGGANPSYQWKVNGNNVGTNSPTYQSNSLQDGNNVSVVVTSSLACASPNTATSNTVTMHVQTGVTPYVHITSTAIDICQGTPVTFTATCNDGNPSYQWKLNGVNVGNNSATYVNSSLAQNDTIRVVMTPSSVCTSSPTATSNAIFMDVSPSVTASVAITASQSSICPGQQVTFHATPTNGGAPHYEWTINNTLVGTDSDSLQISTLQNGDVVKVLMNTSLACALPSQVYDSTTVAINQTTTYFADFDHDGYGNGASGTAEACSAPAGYVSNNSDCNDDNATIYPGATEICGNGIDDNCNGLVDENCNPPSNLPVINLRTYPVKEGDAGLTTLNVEVTLSSPATAPVSVNYATSNASATAGQDYIAASGVLNIPVGSSSGTIQLKIIGDLINESNEIFWLTFSNPVNATLPQDPRSRIMIIDDDKGKNKHTVNITETIPVEEQLLKIPTVARRNTVWTIPQIDKFENEISIMTVQGQLVSKFVNYKNQLALHNLSAGLYFYQVRIKQSNGEFKFYTGRLLITE